MVFIFRFEIISFNDGIITYVLYSFLHNPHFQHFMLLHFCEKINV